MSYMPQEAERQRTSTAPSVATTWTSRNATGKVRYWVVYRMAGKERKEFAGYSVEKARDAEGKRKGQKREGRILDTLPQSQYHVRQVGGMVHGPTWRLRLELTEAARAKGEEPGAKRPSRGYLTKRSRSCCNAVWNATFERYAGLVI